MIGDVILHDSQYNYTDGALILEATLHIILFGRLMEICISAVLMHFSHLLHDLLEVFLPKVAFGHVDYAIQSFLAVDG